MTGASIPGQRVFMGQLFQLPRLPTGKPQVVKDHKCLGAQKQLRLYEL
jgi:hypothetical protein